MNQPSRIGASRANPCRFARFIPAIASLIGAATLSAQVVLTPNQITGRLEFSNTNPDVLAILNSSLPIKQISFEATSIGLVPPRQGFGGNNNPDSPTGTSYQFSVDTSDDGIAYNVLPRYVRLSAPDGVLGGQIYTFVPKDSAPVFPEPAPNVVVNFSECVAILDVRWVDESGAPVAITGGRMGGLSEHPAGSGLFQYSDASGQTSASWPAGTSQQYHALRGGQKWKFYVTTEIGTSPLSDRTRFESQIVIDAVCDTIIPVVITVPSAGSSGSVGRIVGRADLVGEEEHQIAPLIFGDGRVNHALTRVGALEGPFFNERYDYLDLSPSQGEFALENLIPSDAVSPPQPYSVFADFAFRTGNRFGRLQTPVLRGNYTYNQGVFVPPGGTVDLGDTFVIRPGYVAGDLLLAGEVLKDIYQPGNFTDGNGIPLKFNLAHGFGFNWWSQAGTDHTITPGSVLWAYGFETLNLVPGATTHSWFGQAQSLFDGAYNTVTKAFEGDYEMVLGSLNSDPTKWMVNRLWLRLLNMATPEVPESYRDGHVIVEDNINAEQTIVAEQTINVDRQYCFSEVRLRFRTTSGNLHAPAAIYSGKFSGQDFLNTPADYQVPVYPPSYAVGTPRDQHLGTPEALVVFGVPQGEYTIQPQARFVDPSGVLSILQPAAFNVNVGCRQVIDLTPELQLNLDALPEMVNEPALIVTGRVNSDVAVSRVFYTINGGPEIDVCTACGVDPLLSFSLELHDGANLIKVVALDTAGNEASVQSSVQYNAPVPLNHLDPAFGQCGKVITDLTSISDLAPPQYVDRHNHAALQPDGKILVGMAPFDDGTGRRFTVLRYHPAGSLDQSFGSGGVAALDYPGFIGTSMTLDRDGKLVVAGYAPGAGTGIDWVVARRNPDGAADTSFGGDGWVSIDFGGLDDYLVLQGHGIQARLVSVDSQNRIVVKGRAGGAPSVARLNSDGTLDSTFDGDGKLSHFFSYAPLAMTLDSADRILVAGYVDHATDFFVYRLNLDGSFDTSFDVDGQVRIDFDNRHDIAGFIDTDGANRIIVGGWSQDASGARITVFARLNDNGTLDPAFSDDGKVQIPFNFPTAMGVDSANRVILGGNTEGIVDFTVFRLTESGTLDASFGGAGQATVDFCGTYELTYDLAIDGQNNIILPGRVATGPSEVAIAMVRLLSGDSALPTEPCVPPSPTISCPADMTIFANANGQASIPDLTAQALLGNVTPCNSATVTQSPAPGTLVTCGTHEVTLTMTDAAGQSSACTTIVTVVDPNPPAITCPPDLVVAFGMVPAPAETLAEFIAQGGTIVGNCNAEPEITSSDSIIGSCPQVIARTYIATGVSGATTTCTQTITVQSLFAADGIIWHQPLARNGMSDDTDPSAGGTLKYRFKQGSTIPIKIHAVGCGGDDVTANANVIGKVEVFGDTNCDGVADGNELPIDYNGVGEAGGLMDKIGQHLHYNLDTKKLPATSQCYILQVTVIDTSTGESSSESIPLQAK